MISRSIQDFKCRPPDGRRAGVQTLKFFGNHGGKDLRHLLPGAEMPGHLDTQSGMPVARRID